MFTCQNLPDVFEYALKTYGERQLFYTRNKNYYFKPLPFPGLYNQARHLAAVLAEMGLKPRSGLAVFADNRMEWMLADIAVQLNGAYNVPRGTDSMSEELEYILNHSEAEICIVENRKAYNKVKKIIANTGVKTLIGLDERLQADDVIYIHDLLKKDVDQKYIDEVESRRRNIRGDDLFTLIYTSGTTGVPKGVMLSHSNMMYQIRTMPGLLDMQPVDKVLSVLPVWHIFERVLEYQVLYAGGHIYYSSPKDLREDFIRVKPNFMGSAPRLWESVYYRLKERVDESEAINRWLFETGYNVKKDLHRAANYLSGNRVTLEKESPLERLTNTLKSAATMVTHSGLDLYFDAVSLRRIRAVVGGELKGTISGGGALPAHIDEFFNALGIPVCEGYGMTETCPIISVRPHNRIIQGTVGFVTPGNEVEIRDEQGRVLPPGEIGVVHIKGPGVMQGYYKNEEATRAVLNNGWLNTGDLGMFDLNGALMLKGRAKDTIVLMGGENIEPVPVENELLDESLIEQCIVIGQDRKNLGVLIWPDFDQLRDAGFEVHESDDLTENKEVMALFKRKVKERINSEAGFKDFEMIAHVSFLPRRMQTDDELTKLGKVKRNRVTEKYAAQIDALYG